MNGQQKIEAIFIIALAILIGGITVNVGLNNYREDKLNEKALANGYVQKLDHGYKLWVKSN